MYAIGASRRTAWTVHPLLRERLAITLFLLAAAIFLYVDGRTAPIVLWDESRNIINALEMRKTGLSLVTTYGFDPDLWNTKPPLLIWLMYGSMALFGPSEWALRLPSAIAALATLLIVILFVRRFASLNAGLAAGALLLLSPGYYSDHGGRTADYDAVLIFFTTAFLQLLFLALHKPQPGLRISLLVGGMLACALLTKSSAALVSAAGVPLYLLAVGRWQRPFQAFPRYVVIACTALLPFLVFCAAREAAAPGYMDAVFFNDLVGRFQQTLIGRETSPVFYVEALFLGWFLAGPFVVLAPLAAARLPGRKRLLFLYALIVAAAQIAICSLSATRLVHYMMPAFPWLAVAAAIGGAALWKHYVANPGAGTRQVTFAAIIGSALCFLAVQSFAWRYQEIPVAPQARYGELFTALAQQGHSAVTVSDPGFNLDGDADPHYTPQLDGYRMIWAERGLSVRHRTDVPSATGAVLASCNALLVPQLLSQGSDIAGVSGCAAIRGKTKK